MNMINHSTEIAMMRQPRPQKLYQNWITFERPRPQHIFSLFFKIMLGTRLNFSLYPIMWKTLQKSIICVCVVHLCSYGLTIRYGMYLRSLGWVGPLLEGSNFFNCKNQMIFSESQLPYSWMPDISILLRPDFKMHS